uniref:L-dopachrome isomerase n=1 Tax=Fibrocapsa japonica TaxID=94617 RepID=A0A7S2XZL5_9STRA|mmetsp:Transcript_3108/g.4593  ORF Transcript_3108/g.4593 Transcript_3108/m.4593 type:complete len:116 (+) Transcript_3108:89-436(+)
MPFANIITNVDLSAEQKQEVLDAVTGAVCSTLGKPDAYMAVNLTVSSSMMFGKSTDPCAVVNVQSIGFGRSSNKGTICSEISDTLSSVGIPAERVYVNFADFSASDWGMGGNMFG